MWDWLGVPHGVKQMVAMVAGGVMGILCLAGLLILIHRRLTNARVSAVTRRGDKLLLLWLLTTFSSASRRSACPRITWTDT